MLSLAQVEVEVNDILKQLDKKDQTEEQKDATIRRLDDLATLINNRYKQEPIGVSKRLHDVYALSAGKTLAPIMVQTKTPVLYEDDYELFPRKTPTVKMVALMEGLQSGPETAHTHADHNAIRTQLRDAVFSPGRENWLRDSSKHMCKHCKDQVLGELFGSVMEMLTVELKERQRQLNEWFEQRSISEVDFKHLLKHFEQASRDAERLVEEVEHGKVELASQTEIAFRILIRLLNEMMFRYVQMENLRKSIKTSV